MSFPCSSKFVMPCVDGHFWVVRDGKIIDPYFPEFDYIRKVWNCPTEERIYLPAPEMTQQIMKAIYQKAVSAAFGPDKAWEHVMMEYRNLSVDVGYEKPTFGRCFQNCVFETYLRGGHIVFGSMAFRKADGSLHYEYGGPHYKTVKHFTH